MSGERLSGELLMPNQVVYVTGLPFGKGAIGERYPLLTDGERQEFADNLLLSTRPFTKGNTADCVDERRTIALADGTDDPDLLRQRVVPQKAGGLGLPVTKAAVGADLAVIRDARDFRSAYEIMVDLLVELGYEDGGHGDCGASKKVEVSVADEIEVHALMGTLPALTSFDHSQQYLLDLNRQTKNQRLESGYYGTWSNTWHESFLADRFPQNFSILAVDHEDTATHGHNGSGLYVVRTPGVGFAKNDFIDRTGKESFATTVSTADTLTQDIISRIGGSQEERARLRLEFAVDPAQVLNQLVVRDFPAFADAA